MYSVKKYRWRNLMYSMRSSINKLYEYFKRKKFDILLNIIWSGLEI
jgi:hypothetical protein